MAKEIKYKDLDLSFNAHPLTGDINILEDIDAVKRSVRNLVLHDFYERPFESDIGSGVKQSLFENIGPVEIYRLRANILSVIKRHEPRATVLDIRIIEKVDENALDVTIDFKVNNMTEPVSVTIFLERVR